MDALNNKINLRIYKQRAEILCKYFRILKTNVDIDIISCEAQVASFTAKLFQNMPSFLKTTNCPQKCQARVMPQAVISVKETDLNDLGLVLKDFASGTHRCNGIGCSERTSAVDVKIGNEIVIIIIIVVQ